MCVPAIGTYVSEDSLYTIEILTANPSNGEITMNYTSHFGQGSATTETVSAGGGYAWVSNNGQSGTVPFNIRFGALLRPSGRPFAIYEVWAGYYLDGNKMVLAGTRSAVRGATATEPAEPAVTCIGGITFALQ